MYKNIDNIIDTSLWNKQYSEGISLRGLSSFVSRESQTLLATIIYQIKEIKKIDKVLYIEGGNGLFNRDFNNNY